MSYLSEGFQIVTQNTIQITIQIPPGDATSKVKGLMSHFYCHKSHKNAYTCCTLFCKNFNMSDGEMKRVDVILFYYHLVKPKLAI